MAVAWVLRHPEVTSSRCRGFWIAGGRMSAKTPGSIHAQTSQDHPRAFRGVRGPPLRCLLPRAQARGSRGLLREGKDLFRRGNAGEIPPREGRGTLRAEVVHALVSRGDRGAGRVEGARGPPSLGHAHRGVRLGEWETSPGTDRELWSNLDGSEGAAPRGVPVGNGRRGRGETNALCRDRLQHALRLGGRAGGAQPGRTARTGGGWMLRAGSLGGLLGFHGDRGHGAPPARGYPARRTGTARGQRDDQRLRARRPRLVGACTGDREGVPRVPQRAGAAQYRRNGPRAHRHRVALAPG